LTPPTSRAQALGVDGLQLIVVLTLALTTLVPLAVLLGAIALARPPSGPCPEGTWRFAFAPMDGLNLGLTVVVGVMVACVPFVPLLLAGLWLYMRPTCFELSSAGLDLVWPLRRERIPLGTLAGVELLSRAAVNARYGRGYRFGAGGFGGGFGKLITPKQTFRMYISRLDQHVLIHAREGMSLLLTPADAPGFVERLSSLGGWGRR
jgi:hypothetical protein